MTANQFLEKAKKIVAKMDAPESVREDTIGQIAYMMELATAGKKEGDFYVFSGVFDDRRIGSIAKHLYAAAVYAVTVERIKPHLQDLEASSGLEGFDTDGALKALVRTGYIRVSTDGVITACEEFLL